MENKNFRIAVIIVSDRAASGERPDESGPAIKAFLEERGFSVAAMEVIPDDAIMLRNLMLKLTDESHMDLILTSGGTGLSPRDITPETTLDIADKTVPGFAEAIRAYSLTKTKHAMISRGVAVVRDRTLIINFPGNPRAGTESLEAVIEALPHALGMLRGEKLDK